MAQLIGADRAEDHSREADAPKPSEGQQRLQYGICGQLWLLGLMIGEQIIQELRETDQPPAPALLAEPEQRAIAVGREVQPAGGMQVNRGCERDDKAWPWRNQRRSPPPSGAGSRTRAIRLTCRVMRHQRQPTAGMAPILEVAPDHEEA